jgi:hypothetical protein
MDQSNRPTVNLPGPHPQGIGVLVAGIIGVWACGVVFGAFAWIQGSKALREIDANPGVYSNRAIVNVGRILGMIATILWSIIIVFAIISYMQQPR